MTDYPPLTPLEEMPLHSGGVDYPAGWFACEHPERPRTGKTMYDWRCSSCVLAAVASIVNQGDQEMLWHRVAGDAVQKVTLSWQVERARAHGVLA